MSRLVTNTYYHLIKIRDGVLPAALVLVVPAKAAAGPRGVSGIGDCYRAVRIVKIPLLNHAADADQRRHVEVRVLLDVKPKCAAAARIAVSQHHLVNIGRAPDVLKRNVGTGRAVLALFDHLPLG